MEKVKISWYEGLENYMTVAESGDAVLAAFFTVREWAFVQSIYPGVATESDLHLADRGFLFCADGVEIYTPEGESRIAQKEFFMLMKRLYAILIDGANEDHHSVRYELWWQAFIDAAYALDAKCHILAVTEEESIITDRLSNR
jgi:hypothetical protein